VPKADVSRLHALIFEEELSLRSHADAPKSSGAFFTVWTGKVPETAGLRQKRAEELYRGAAK